MPPTELTQDVSNQLARLRTLHIRGGSMAHEIIGDIEEYDVQIAQQRVKTKFVQNVSVCLQRIHAMLPNGVCVCFDNEYRMAVHALVNTSSLNRSNAKNKPSYMRTYYMRYYPQGVSLQLLQPRFIHPGPETPLDSDLIVLSESYMKPNDSFTTNINSLTVENKKPNNNNHYNYQGANLHDCSLPNKSSVTHESTDTAVHTTASSENSSSTIPKVTPITPPPYIIKKLQPISCEEHWQPHRVVQRYWQEHAHGYMPLPWWLQEPFNVCYADQTRTIELYCGLQHYYVWYPLELQDESQYTTHRAYCLVVNRVHWIEWLFEQERLKMRLPRYIVQCLTCIQDQHHFLQLLMCETHWYSDEQLQKPVESFAPSSAKNAPNFDFTAASNFASIDNSIERTNDSEDASDTLLIKWQTLRRIRERMSKSGRWDASQIPLVVHATTVLDMYMPSYDLVFHEGELPDLTLLLILIGAFNTPNRADRPVQISNEILPLMNLMWKALLMPMKLRDHTRASSEKTQDSQLTFECQLRMVMAFYGGYYSTTRIITSFYTRHHLYRDLAYRQCSRKDFCNFLVGHYTHDATRQGVVPVRHKHLSLIFVKTYLFNMIRAVPSLHDMMSARYVGHNIVIEKTLKAVERCLQTREDMWYGCGARWDRFERTYNAYVERIERLKSKCRMTLGDDDGNEIDINDMHRSQSAKRRTLEPRADCPFIFKRHKASSRAQSGEGAVAPTRSRHNARNNPTAMHGKNNALMPAPEIQQPTLRANLYLTMRGFICSCVRFLLDQLANTDRWGPSFQCVMYDQDHLDCDFDWFGRRGEQISVREVIERVRSGAMTCDAAALCITVTQDRVVHHYLQVTQQKALPQFAASRMTNRCKYLVTARLMRDMRVRFNDTQHEPAQYVSDHELMNIYCSDVDRVSEGMFTDHRALTYPLHARSLLFHNSQRAPRCSCYHCNPRLPPAMKYDTHFLYRQLQQQISCGALWAVTMSAPSMDLCESIIHNTYHNNLELMYRIPNTSFVDNVVHSMNVAREDSRNNERFVKAAARITEGERRLIATCVERLDVWKPVQYEWFGHLLSLDQTPLQTLRNAEHMFNTHTYPVDVSTTIRDMPLCYPREFLLLEQLFTEIYWRRMVQVHRLPYEWTRQQVYSAHERHALVPYGEPLPLKMFEAYYCPHHGDIKRHIARNEPWITASVGCTTAVGLDHRTNEMYCTSGFKRGVARANGAQHRWRTVNDRKCDDTESIMRNSNSRASLSVSERTVQTNQEQITSVSRENVTPSTQAYEHTSYSSFVDSWSHLQDDDDANDTPINCAADVFMSVVSSVSGPKEHVVGKPVAKRQPKRSRAAANESSKRQRTSAKQSESDFQENSNGQETFAHTTVAPLESEDDEDENENFAAHLADDTMDFTDDNLFTAKDFVEEQRDSEDGLSTLLDLPSPLRQNADSIDEEERTAPEQNTSNRRADKCYNLKAVVKRNRGRGPSAFSYQRHHLERLAYQHLYQQQLLKMQQNSTLNFDATASFDRTINMSAIPKIRQHRYRQAFHRSQDARCNAPLERVCMLGHTLVLYGATFLACPMCNTIFRLQWSSFTDAHYMPLCGLCIGSMQQKRAQLVAERIYAPCHCCNSNSAIHKPEQTTRHLVLDDTTPGPHFWRYIHLCNEHNREHIGDCESNSLLSILELYIAHRVRYIHMNTRYADGRSVFIMMPDHRTNASHPFDRGDFNARPDSFTSTMNAVDTSTKVNGSSSLL